VVTGWTAGLLLEDNPREPIELLPHTGSGGSPVSLGVQTEAFIDLSVHPNGGELAFVGVASDLEIWRLEGLSQSLAHALTPRTQATQAKQ
jgi:hypothetical protein